MNLNKMSKRFLRSAVNQIGRDGGRVVSNKIYGNRHAIRIQNVKNGTASTTGHTGTFTEYDVKELNDKYFEDRTPFVEEGFRSKTSKLGSGYLILFTFLSLIPVLGQILWIWIVVILVRSMNTTIMTGYFDVPVYKPDRRYKEGVRYIGDEAVKVSINTRSTREERRNYLWELLYVLVVIPVFWLILYFGSR